MSLLPRRLGIPVENRRILKNVESDIRPPKDPWTVRYLKRVCDDKYGENSMIFDHIQVNDIDEVLKNDEKILVGCKKCEFLWYSECVWLNTGKKGCPWCKNKCANIRNYDLYTVNFIGTRLHDNKYQYLNFNKDEDITSSKSILKFWCGKEDHSVTEEPVGKHLTKSIRYPSKGCFLCFEEEKEEDEDKRKRYDREVFIRRSKKIHGENSYNYDKVLDEDIKTAYSQVRLICKRLVGVNDYCNHEFLQKINDHINCKSRCPACYRSDKYTRESFIESMNKYYNNGEFLYHLIKDEDIENKRSKPKVVCSKCNYLIDNTEISDFLHCVFKRECDQCFSHLPWTLNRLLENFEEREKEDLLEYPRLDYPEKLKSTDLVTFICLVCKKKGYKLHKFEQTLDSHFILKRGCLRCSKSMPWSFERFHDDIPEIFKTKYDYRKILKNSIQNQLSLVPIICNTCEETFWRTPYDHIYELRGCKYCPKSRGSKLIYMYLKNKNIPFEEETRIIGVNGYYCFYDYEICLNGVNIIIEMDGKQHFEFTEYYHKIYENFDEARKRDVYKHYKALKDGKRIIRIDDSFPPKQIERFLDFALKSNKQECFSTPSMYDWLIEGVKIYENN